MQLDQQQQMTFQVLLERDQFSTAYTYIAQNIDETSPENGWFRAAAQINSGYGPLAGHPQ